MIQVPPPRRTSFAWVNKTTLEVPDRFLHLPFPGVSAHNETLQRRGILTMLQVGHPGGLCNRLDVITTGYVLARDRGEEEIEVLWPLNSHMPSSFHDLFT